MSMKKHLVYGLAALTLLASCRKDEPTPQPKPEDPKKEQPQPGQPQQPQPDEPKKPEQPTEPKQPDTPKPDEPQQERPSDYTLAKRLQAAWSATPAQYLKALPFDAYYAEGKKEAIGLEQLLPLLQLTSSSVEGKTYTLTEAERKELKLQSLSYQATEGSRGQFALVLSYKGVPSEQLYLPFDRHAYFGQFVQLQSDFAPKHYLAGVYEYLDVYMGELLSYDRSKYAVQLISGSKQQSETSRSLSFRVQVTRIGTTGDDILAVLSYEASGFKALSGLGSELTVVHKSELGTKLYSLAKGATDEASLLQRLKQRQGSWLREEYLQFGLKVSRSLVDLTWDESKQVIYGGNEQRGAARDLWLKRPRFELRSAKQEGTKLYLQIALVSVGDLAFGDKAPVLPLTVIGFRPER